AAGFSARGGPTGRPWRSTQETAASSDDAITAECASRFHEPESERIVSSRITEIGSRRLERFFECGGAHDPLLHQESSHAGHVRRRLRGALVWHVGERIEARCRKAARREQKCVREGRVECLLPYGTAGAKSAARSARGCD